jgi:hypothetical protein
LRREATREIMNADSPWEVRHVIREAQREISHEMREQRREVPTRSTRPPGGGEGIRAPGVRGRIGSEIDQDLCDETPMS